MPWNRQTMIIIAACASAGGIIFAFFFFRILSRLYRSDSTPFPPPQPLAHHREQQLAQFEDRTGPSRPTTWYDSAHLLAPVISLNGSNISLLPKPTDEAQSTTVSVPNISLHASVSTRSSLGSIPRDSFVPQPQASPTSIDSSYLSHSTSFSSNYPLQPRSRSASASRPRSAHRPRPTSVASNSSTTPSRRSRNPIRGTPHGPLSQVQIVLPTPLALGHSPYAAAENGLSLLVRDSSRLSVVDNWASVAVTSSTDLASRPRPSSMSGSSSHRPPSPSSSDGTYYQASHSLSSSSSSAASAPSSFRMSSPAPPVPPIPSVYNTYTLPDYNLEERSETTVTPPHRGRSPSTARLNSSSTVASPGLHDPPSPSPRPSRNMQISKQG